MFTLVLYFYLSAVALAWIASLRSFLYNYPKHLKMFSILLGITLLVELTANFFLKMMHIKGYRSALYNQFALFEFILYGFFYYQVIQNRQIKKLIVFFICLFPVLWVYTTFFEYGYKAWNSAVITIGAYFTVLFSLLYVYHSSAHTDATRLANRSEFWIAIGMILFYSCQIPYFGILNVLNKISLSLSKSMLLVSMSINAIMYYSFTYAYLCRKTKY